MIISIYLTKNSLNKIDSFAEAKDISRSSAIRIAINSYLKDNNF